MSNTIFALSAAVSYASPSRTPWLLLYLNQTLGLRQPHGRLRWLNVEQWGSVPSVLKFCLTHFEGGDRDACVKERAAGERSVLMFGERTSTSARSAGEASVTQPRKRIARVSVNWA